MKYYGIVIEESLRSSAVLSGFDIVAHKRQGGWRFLLVALCEADLGHQIERLQQEMIPVAEDCWYNHFFAGERLVVVYQDRVFHTTVNPADGAEVIQYGLSHGIPREQLDFNPCSLTAAAALFGVESLSDI